MENYIDTLVCIYEACANGDISISERDELVLEMKSRKEYNMRKWKKRFKFTPSKDNPNRGTINVDGETIKVDIGNGRITKFAVGDEIIDIPRQNMCNFDDGMVYIDPEILMKLKNKKRIDAVTYHEIGHSKFQGAHEDGKATALDADISKKLVDSIIKEFGKGYDKTIILQTVNYYMKKYRHKIQNNPNQDDTIKELRREIIDKMKKYEKQGHTNFKEFEADKYALSKSDAKDLAKGIEEVGKKTIKREKKRIGLTDKEDKELRKTSNTKSFEQTIRKMQSDNFRASGKVIKDDIDIRKKVMKDKEIQSDKYKDVYK